MKLWSAVGKGATGKENSAEITRNNIVKFHSKVQDKLLQLLGTDDEDN